MIGAENSISARIRHATISDLPRLMEYIGNEWKPGHILARDVDFFKYQYQNGDRLNFILSEDSRGAIDGMLGFISAASGTQGDVWTTMWKASRTSGNPMLGIQLLQFLKNQGHRSMLSLGINPKTMPIYRYLGYTTGAMQHHYLRNLKRTAYQIASFPALSQSPPADYPRYDSVNLKLVNWAEFEHQFPVEVLRQVRPTKDFRYIRHRYFEHPIYQYRTYGVFDQLQMVALLVMRIVYAENSAVLRLVDILGDVTYLPMVAEALNRLLESEDLEYLDLVSYGVDNHVLQRAGFQVLDPTSETVIVPNYFQPFVRKNASINFFIDGDLPANLRMFKADGDQDRPS